MARVMAKTARPTAPKSELVRVLLLRAPPEGLKDRSTDEHLTFGSEGKVSRKTANDLCSEDAAIVLPGAPTTADDLPPPLPDGEGLEGYIRRTVLRDPNVHTLTEAALRCGIWPWEGSPLRPASVAEERQRQIMSRLQHYPDVDWLSSRVCSEVTYALPTGVGRNWRGSVMLSIGGKVRLGRDAASALILALLRHRDALLVSIFARLRSGDLVVTADEVSKGGLSRQTSVRRTVWSDPDYTLRGHELVAEKEKLPDYRMLTIGPAALDEKEDRALTEAHAGESLSVKKPRLRKPLDEIADDTLFAAKKLGTIDKAVLRDVVSTRQMYKHGISARVTPKRLKEAIDHIRERDGLDLGAGGRPSKDFFERLPHIKSKE